MTESSPAIYRRVRGRKRLRPVGTLDLRGDSGLQSSLWDGSRIGGQYPAINRRATFECPSGTSVSHLATFAEVSVGLLTWHSLMTPCLDASTHPPGPLVHRM